MVKITRIPSLMTPDKTNRGVHPMLMTTTSHVEGQKIHEYHGIVVGEAILGANVFKDIFAGITDIIGGRSGSYEKELGKAREIAIEDMISGNCWPTGTPLDAAI